MAERALSTILEFESEISERQLSRNFVEHEDHAATMLSKRVDMAIKQLSGDDLVPASAIHSATVPGRKLASWVRIGKNREFNAQWSSIFYDDHSLAASSTMGSQKDSRRVPVQV